VLVESSKAEDEDGRELPFVVGRSYRDAPEVDGVVLLQGAFAPGQMVRARVTQALAYDVVAEPLAVAAGA
jgi:ribosomal protein S12 methylthiotransferase